MQDVELQKFVFQRSGILEVCLSGVWISGVCLSVVWISGVCLSVVWISGVCLSGVWISEVCHGSLHFTTKYTLLVCLSICLFGCLFVSKKGQTAEPIKPKVVWNLAWPQWRFIYDRIFKNLPLRKIDFWKFLKSMNICLFLFYNVCKNKMLTIEIEFVRNAP